MQPAHAHDFTSISFLARGQVRETAARVRHDGVAGDVIVRPLGTIHADDFGERGAKTFAMLLDEDVGAYRWLPFGAASSLFVRATLAWRAGEAWEEIATDLVAAIHQGGPRAHPLLMQEVAERVATTEATVMSLAREIGMHPVALARTFRRAHGCSITYYHRRARIRRAVELLTSSVPLAEIALESGFTDQSHFCRVFKTEMGVTPSSFRNIAV